LSLSEASRNGISRARVVILENLTATQRSAELEKIKIGNITTQLNGKIKRCLFKKVKAHRQ